MMKRSHGKKKKVVKSTEEQEMEKVRACVRPQRDGALTAA